MKQSTTWRSAAIGATFALLGAALVPGAASAADLYYPDVVLGEEDETSDRGYPDSIWFTGGGSTGEQTQTDDGLTVTGKTALLYGAAETPLTGASFVALAQGIEVDADGPWSLQLSVYLDNEDAGWFTTYRPAASNTAPGDLDSEWISTWPTLTHGKNERLTLQDISDEIDAVIDEEYEPVLLAYGVFVDTGWDPLTLRSFTIDGDTHFFTPEPTPEPDPEPVGPQPVPNPVTLSDVSSNKSSEHYTQFHKEIQWLANTGITKGWSVGGGKYEFRAHEEITREAMAAFMYRAAGSPAVNLPATSPFADVNQNNTNFYKEIVWMNQENISNGWAMSSGKNEFRPKDNITRDAMAAFMYRFAGKPAFTAPAASPFADVSKSGTQFYKEITWLQTQNVSNGWVMPSGKNEYRPYDEISRAAMAAFLNRYYERVV